jgi:hypothetical protein
VGSSSFSQNLREQTGSEEGFSMDRVASSDFRAVTKLILVRPYSTARECGGRGITVSNRWTEERIRRTEISPLPL